MKLFENIKDFFFAAEDEDGDFADTPMGAESREQRQLPLSAARLSQPRVRMLLREQAEETR